LRLVLAGGGTGGHLSPGIAIAERLAEQDPELDLTFVCSCKPLDAHVLSAAGLTSCDLPTAPFPYGVSLQAAVSGVRLLGSLARAHRLLRKLRPQAVMGVGGYVSVPVVLAARMLGIPTAIHVLDAQPDRANLLLASRSRWITVAFPETAARFPADRTEVTGCPVRRSILEASRTAAQEELGLDPALVTVLVMGGSLGAHQINAALVGALPVLLSRLPVQIIHLAGAGDYEQIAAETATIRADQGRYRLLAFSDEMGQLLAAADLVVGRAGSSSMAEASGRGLPQILVPYPHAGGHQTANALSLESVGGAIILPNSECTPAALSAQISALVESESRRQQMARMALRWAAPEAAERLAAGLLALARGEKPN
jgi:UDP-N-acetylglucosamine--N-acetylmuramyl-(pentapeptide) pyrophosphoryl-undecaprenol N-acetylglucosamine transferase